MATALSYNNNLLKFNNYVIDPSSTPVPPTPQEVIIPVLSTDEYFISYDINDIPLNTLLTFSYTNYSGNPNTPPTYIRVEMGTDDWSEYESVNANLTDKVATFTITNKGNYTKYVITLHGVNEVFGIDFTVQLSLMSGYKLSYTV